MLKDIKDYVATCDLCQRNKDTTQSPPRLLHQPQTPLMSGTHFSMDFIGSLPHSQWNAIWYNMIFVYRDHYNGWIFPFHIMPFLQPKNYRYLLDGNRTTLHHLIFGGREDMDKETASENFALAKLVIWDKTYKRLGSAWDRPAW